MTRDSWTPLNAPPELSRVLEKSQAVHVAGSIEELFDLACGGPDQDFLEVGYILPDGGRVIETTVVRVRNGIAVNYPDPYMRRRDPDCMVIADEKTSDKPRFSERFGEEFGPLRQETLDWLADQELAIFAFRTGRKGMGEDALAVVPANAAFFALGLALLQGILSPVELPPDFSPRTIIYVAPPFRHTHFKGEQVVVHDRTGNLHEIFSYNLYPGPSAKKGVYGSLLRLGEEEGWVTAHCSAVQVVTPYDNVMTIMHEGASGGGKSEMLEQPHRLPDGRMLKGRNLVTGEKRYIEIPRTCDLRPICDDMALCHPDIQQANGKLWLVDAEEGWFVRVNHITEYGADYDLEKLTSQPSRPLVFFNIDAAPHSRALIWEHIEDEPGVPCPNPRVIIPRSIVANIINEPIAVDVRSIGVRTPPCTREKPSYGIMGLFHVLPPALAWLWRLVAPRGFANPSIVGTEKMSSEGVGSYWPFMTGSMVRQANLLLRQFEETPRTRYVLIPNQHIGAWEVGFMAEWLARDYLARRGAARFKGDQIVPARCTLLGYALSSMRIEGVRISHWFLEVNTQPEVGDEGYDQGAAILREFFCEHLEQYLKPDISSLGRQIIECCLDDGSLEDYEKLLGKP
ncbi:MAG: DUF4914 family protein [Actinobacteria bacterium]|nr:DUF4914 family protein [Actinomycetota bacterium]MCG2817719.1 DUF4914 family protein [Actinomycetes bacterium]MBU4217511.1 DUF4914 family protein [Actinomycetota bacterium]MBU4358216.1 DUF4914 family protein [Actinomycetota bacterium]MBU4392606.1 DUF4914 family protein [Actinomycetota bacterium]